MRVLMVSTDTLIFNEGSAVRERMMEYGSLAEELHIIVFARRYLRRQCFQLGDNVWIYPTNSRLKLLFIVDAYRIAKQIIINYKLKRKHWIITTQDPFETGLVGYWLKKKFGVPLQIQVHTDFLSPYFWRESWKNKIRVLLAKWLIRKADSIRVVSQRIKNALIMFYPLLSRAIVVLPIFVDIEKIKNTSIKADLHKKYPSHDFIILMASRLTKEKNIGLAIEAMMTRNSEIKNPLLLVIGEGPEAQKLKTKIEKLKVTDSVKFEPWTDDLASYYKTADLFLLTSNYEGYGRTAIEALAAGLPVVMSDVGLAGELVKNGESGFVFPVGNEGALKEILRKILNKEIDLEKLKNGVKTVVNALPNKAIYLESMRSSWESLLR